MSTKDFLVLGKETNKGSALHSVKDEGAAGAYDFATLTYSGILVDQEVFQLGDDVYEVNIVTTDTGAEATAEVTAGDTSFVFDTAPTIPLLPGDVIRMEVEFMIVIDYNVNGPSVNVLRGQFGSTDVTHSIANSDTFQAAQPVVDGNFAVPTSSTDESVGDAQIASAVQFWSDGGYSKGLGGGIGVRVQNGLKVDAINTIDDVIVFAYPADGGVADTDASDQTNGAITAFGGGVEEASQLYSVIWHVWTADDDTAGSKEFYAPFDVVEAVVTAFESDGSPHRTQSGTDELNFDGAVTVTASRLVSVSEGTADVLTAGDIIKLEFFG